MVTLIPASVPAARRLGVVIGLHGAGATPATSPGQLSPAMTAAGITSFAAVTVDGGDTYWHKRADGDDPAGMIMHEVLPRPRPRVCGPARIGIIGLSMGGYGALLLAERQLASRSALARPRGRRRALAGDLRQLRRRARRQPDVLRQPGGLHPQRRVRGRWQRCADVPTLDWLRHR